MFADNAILTGCIFTSNYSKNSGGAIFWEKANGTLSDSIFTSNNSTLHGGGIYWNGINGIITNSIFKDNIANVHGGGVFWTSGGINGSLSDSTFTNNNAKNSGGGIFWQGINGSLDSSIFTSNTANYGGGIYWWTLGYMINCSFLNTKWSKINGIYAHDNLNINGGSGIIDLVISQNISGISIVVLNNETYYYPPNTNINFFELK